MREIDKENREKGKGRRKRKGGREREKEREVSQLASQLASQCARSDELRFVLAFVSMKNNLSFLNIHPTFAFIHLLSS